MTEPAAHQEASVHNLEGAAPPAERRWMIVCLGLLAVLLVYSAWTVRRLTSANRLAPAAAVDHGPLPASVRAEVLALLEPHLEHATLQELHTGKVREFHISGKPKELLAQEFYAAFRPLVVSRLMPLLRPYGEIISFDITALDLPPARLREIPKDSYLIHLGPIQQFTIGDFRLTIWDDPSALGLNRKSKIENRKFSQSKDS